VRFDNSVLVADARAARRGSALWLEVVKGILFLMFTSMIADTLFVIVIEEILAIQDDTMLTILYLYWQIVVIVLCALFANFVQHRTLGFKMCNIASAYLRGLLIGAGMITVVTLIGLIVGAFSFHGLSEWLNAPLILLFLGGYMVQGAAEEVLCRGYILLAIARKNRVSVAVIFRSLIFAFMHSNNTGFGVIPVINLFLFAVFEAIYFLKTENIWGISAIHTAWNFVQGCIFGFGVSGESLMPSLLRFSCSDATVISGGQFGPEGGLIVTAVTAVSIVLLLRKNSGS
jgi:membrane protease YdiL (CAAX protease family)